MTTLKSQAVQTALTGDWNNAILINEQILKETPNDIDTLNRLAFAFLGLGDSKKAKTLLEKVLLLDAKNPIALRNLKRVTEPNNKKQTLTLNNLFIEEPGKTKVIELLNIADKKVLSHLRSGEMLRLTIKRNKIFALDLTDQYVGMLPDDICRRLIKFMEAGNLYEAYTRTIDNNKVCVFIRETKRAKRFLNQPSFVSTEKAKLSVKPIPQGFDDSDGEEESL